MSLVSKLPRLRVDLLKLSANVIASRECSLTPLVSASQRLFLYTSSSCEQCVRNNNRQRNSLTDHHSNVWHHPGQSQQFATIAREPDGVLSRMWKGLGFSGKLRYKKPVLQAAGLRLYLCCAELVDYAKFFDTLELPDTFNSWYRVTELHMWMLMVRLAEESQEGKFVRNSMVRYMWQDVEKRSKKLGQAALTSQRREGIQMLSEQFKSAIFAYDEGLLDDDKVLAGAIWRQLLDMKCEDPEKLEVALSYVRRQIAHLDKQDSGVLLTSGLVQFLPLHGDEDEQRTKQILQEILRRV